MSSAKQRTAEHAADHDVVTSGTATVRVRTRDCESDRLLRRYSRRQTVGVRNQLIEFYRPRVESIARALRVRLPRSVDLQDLVHAGVWGLMQAIDGFEPDRGVEFAQYMQLRVRGAMLDELRNLDFLPRLYRQLNRDRDFVLASLRNRLSRDPSDAEVADELGVSESRLRLIASSVLPFEVANRDLTDSSDGPGAGGNRGGSRYAGIDHLPDLGIENPIEALDRQDLLAKIEASLQPLEWKVLEMHYLEGLAGKEIARRLRLSASRICQIHVRVLSRLKARLGAAAC